VVLFVNDFSPQKNKVTQEKEKKRRKNTGTAIPISSLSEKKNNAPCLNQKINKSKIFGRSESKWMQEIKNKLLILYKCMEISRGQIFCCLFRAHVGSNQKEKKILDLQGVSEFSLEFT
jgi:hypothetical protein